MEYLDRNEFNYNPAPTVIETVKIFDIKKLCFYTKYDYDKSLWAGDYTDGLRGIMSKKVNNTYASYLFEGKVIQGFKYYDDYLTQIYGNYMQMPKEDHQRQHNFYYLNLDEPYSIYKEKN